MLRLIDSFTLAFSAYKRKGISQLNYILHFQHIKERLQVSLNIFYIFSIQKKVASQLKYILHFQCMVSNLNSVIKERLQVSLIIFTFSAYKGKVACL